MSQLVNENPVPDPPTPEQPPFAPYDPPAPAPQAEAWRRALKVVTGEVTRRVASAPKARSGRSWSRSTDDPESRH
ncbi:MAG TPA: hypothetical protein VKP66_13315 [Steroidobacteraceae bacterium]|nr:hypothetical protein [Steroidobacteraceae bacterium]